MVWIQVIERDEQQPPVKASIGAVGWFLIILVVLAVAGVIAAIVIPNVMNAREESRKTADAVNLKRLMEAVLVGQAEARAKRIPRSVGYRFWLSLCVGDGPGAGNLEITGADDPDIYLQAGDAASLLISPADLNRMTPEEVHSELAFVVESGAGVNGLSDADLMCSYAGPVDPRRDIRNRENPLVGCTRGGIFGDGFNAVTVSAECRWYSYEDMAAGYGWPMDTDTPLYGQDPLAHVQE